MPRGRRGSPRQSRYGSQPDPNSALGKRPHRLDAALPLNYRIEPGTTYATVTMVDNGSGGDSVAGDGVYSATLPGQPTGTRMGFYIEATDGLGAVNTFPQDVFPTPPDTRVFPMD